MSHLFCSAYKKLVSIQTQIEVAVDICSYCFITLPKSELIS